MAADLVPWLLARVHEDRLDARERGRLDLLAECDVKTATVEQYCWARDGASDWARSHLLVLEGVVKEMTTAYADRPGFCEEWRPSGS